MSLILETGNNKSKCQKFTPNSLVKTMLDLLDYKTNVVGKTILENSFGNGRILKAIVISYIESAINSGYSKDSISIGLAKDIYGVELDKELFDTCINELNQIAENYEIPAVKWNLYNTNALTIEFGRSFDYIIGNPPYISYKEMDLESRKLLKEKFKCCSTGKYDYCYAFIELGVSLLKSNGKLVQLIPNNIYKNVFAKKLREILIDHISKVYDYPEQKLFDKALTSVSIFLYDNSSSSESILYKNITEGLERSIKRQTLGDKWVFTTNVKNYENKIRFGDIFNASVTIATLCNEAFLVEQSKIDEEKIEYDVLRDTVSPKTLRYKKNKKIIFPYKYGENGLIRYSVEDFSSRFPNASNHLKMYEEKLKQRNSDSNALWFEYGRSQALAHLNQEKLLVSTIITNDVEVYKLDVDTIPFSGIYITQKNNKYSLEDAINILKSKDFMEYVRSIGISVSGKSLRITCRDINNYKFFGGL